MSKPTKNRINFNEDALIILKKRFGYSLDYIRKCIRGDREGLMPDTIKKEYKVLTKAAEEAVKNKAEEL
ncbi:hypothetical protein [Pseudotenacibaculum haliotis]|uniref:Uncharacterized protein n=1 Tax=Pseudotenacibaculum haliotis TaxID=1862138 RepID=A0ABW5LNH3_9FLAO